MLTDQVVLVTGAGRGIGRAIALKMAGAGATVIVNYNGSKERAEAVVEEIKEKGGKAEAVGCDVSDFAATEEMIKSIVKSYGRLDVLVNNAGITRDGLLMGMKEADFDAVININLKGAFNCMRHAAKIMMKQRKGAIINLSSVSGVLGNAGQVNYAASKAGIIGMTKSAAKEMASRNVTVNAIAPGFIATDMTDAMPESAKEAVLTKIPLNRVGEPEDIAKTAVFLAEATYITGQVICVDGGMS